MEALPLVLCTGVFAIGVVVGSLALGVYLGRRRGREWAQTCQQLGLTLGPPRRRGVFSGSAPTIHMPMQGQRAGMNVEIGIRVVVRRSGNNRSTEYYTYCKVDFTESLDLGLHMRTAGMLGRAWNALAGQSDLQVGDPELDPLYEIRAIDAEHARALCRIPYVREGLLWHAPSSFAPAIGDERVYLETSGRKLDHRTLAGVLDGAVDLARRIVAGRAQIGLSEGQRAVTERWRLVAQRYGMSVDVEATKIEGRVDGVHVEVDAQIRRNNRITVFTVKFDRPIGVGLKMTRQNSLHSVGKLLGMQDIETGDENFDVRFLVKGNPPDRVRQMLTPEVRVRLAQLSDQAAKLEVHDDRLSAEVAWLVARPEDLESGMRMVSQAAAALLAVSSTEAGPFR